MDTVSRIFELLDKSDMEQREFARQVGVSDDTASDWRRRRSGSYAKRLPKIAEVLGTTVEYLHYGTDPKQDGDPEIAEYLAKFQRLTPEQKAAVQGYMDFLNSQNVPKSGTE